jgi:ketosteroid isomerase-like protein
MSQENMEAAREIFERWRRGDFSGIDSLPGDFEVVTAREMPDAGTYRGDAARRWLNAWVDSFDSLTMELVELTDVGDRVLAEFVQHGIPRGGSTPVDVRTWSLMTRRGGAVSRLDLFLSRDEALEAAGLSE